MGFATVLDQGPTINVGPDSTDWPRVQDPAMIAPYLCKQQVIFLNILKFKLHLIFFLNLLDKILKFIFINQNNFHPIQKLVDIFWVRIQYLYNSGNLKQNI